MTSGNELKETKDSKGNKAPAVSIRSFNVAQYYEILEKVGRGAYGSVFKAKGLKDGRSYAIKKLQNNETKLQQQGFPITALREISLLKQIDHPNIIKLKEIIVSRPNKRNLSRGSTFLVFQYMEHDFAGLFKNKIKFTLPEIKCFLKQLIEGVAYLHRNKILHRDIKSANILLNDQGNVRLADLGLGRKIRLQNYFTYKVVTLWYRAPQLLLGCKTYNDKIDVWSLGCVVAEFFTGQVLFKKQTQYAQMEKIYEIVGDFEVNGMTINDDFQKTYPNLQDLRPRKTYSRELSNYLKRSSPNISQITIDFIERLLHLDPRQRMSCEQALRHPFFSQKPLACNLSEVQKLPVQYKQMFRDRSIKIVRPNIKIHQDIRVEREHREPREPYDHKQRKGNVRGHHNYHKDTRDDHYHSRKRDDRRQYEYRRHEKSYNGDFSSISPESDSYSSSSRSSEYSSSERSRSRQDGYRRKYSRERDNHRYRDEYHRQDRKRIDRKPNPNTKDYHEKRQDKYSKGHGDKRQRYPIDQRKKYDDYEKRKDYRDEHHSSRKDEKRYERRQEYQRRDYVRNDKYDDRKDERIQKRDERKDFHVRRDERHYDNRDKKYEKSSTLEHKDRKYYDDRDYRRKQDRMDEKHSRDKYQDQRHDYLRRDEPYERRNEKSVYVNSSKGGGHRRNDYHSKSSERSQNNHYKKEKDYRHKPYHYQGNQRKPYYKKQHQGNDRVR